MKKMKSLVTSLLCLFPPSRTKNFSLRILGHNIHRTARFGSSLVIGKSLISLGKDSVVRPFNVFRNMSLVAGEGAIIGSWNWFSAAPALSKGENYSAEFLLGTSGSVNSRNYFDCSGGILFGPFTDLAGVRSTFITHYIDTKNNHQLCKPIIIGERTMLSSNLTVMPGAVVGDRSLVAAGTVLIAQSYPSQSLIAGVPGTFKSERSGEWFDRTFGPSSIYLGENE
jgi:acetyltransferase-like isoleucine patch superfamily enzyme